MSYAAGMFLIHTGPEHADVVARSVVAACRSDGWRSALQPRLLHTLFNQLLDRDLDFETLAPLGPAEAAAALRSPEERSELIQLMCAIEILCNPVPADMEETVARWAKALGVEERALVYLRDLARGEVGKSIGDFYRLNWIGDLDRRQPGFKALLAHAGEEAYALTVEEYPQQAARWTALAACPTRSIGRHLFEFYQARGFKFPGQVGAANEAVAHHDWIHLLADYGTTPLGEIEVVSFQTTCTRTPGAVLGLLGTLALFESGAMAAGLITKAYPHEGLSRPGGIERMAEAIARGKACNTDLLLDVDFFPIAHEPLEELRLRFGIPPKSASVRALDSYGALAVPPAT
jgi:hypothetical protein